MHNANNKNKNNDKNLYVDIANKSNSGLFVSDNSNINIQENTVPKYDNDIKENDINNNETIDYANELNSDSNMVYSDLSNIDNMNENNTNDNIDNDINNDNNIKEGIVSIYSSNRLNLREEPNYESAILYILEDGDKLDVLDEITFNSDTKNNEHTYVKVKYNNIVGYCLKRYIRIL